MSGIVDLKLLLAQMEPALDDAEFVFCTVPGLDAASYLGLDPLGIFLEAEGLTLILHPGRAADAGMEMSAPMRRITLTVHSSLEAVGLTAAVSSALAAHGISANMIAAFHHDHVFVPAADAERALAVLRALT